MIALALTGSIGMGKSTTAKMFAEAGARVWDADAAVHRLYAAGGGGAEALAALAPEAASGGAVDRAALRAAILEDPALLPRIESAIHPLVAEDREAFLARARAEGAAVVVCDIPLLLEGGGPAGFDAVVVVTAPEATQRGRVLARPGMTEAAYQAIRARQTPDAEKRARADFVIETGDGLAPARAAVAEVMEWAAARAAPRA